MKYGEMINHPHYEPKLHPRMSRDMRAAQFAPYAALHGHAGAIRKTAKIAEYRSRRVIGKSVDETNAYEDAYEACDAEELSSE